MTENTDNIVPCSDYACMADLWLAASVIAHSFIPRTFWESNVDAMRLRYLPVSESYAYIEDGEVAGFISLNGDHIEALFVLPSHQGVGVGKALLTGVMGLRSRLTLAVYSENLKAVDFYSRNGFSVIEERIDPATRHQEKVMRWLRVAV